MSLRSVLALSGALCVLATAASAAGVTGTTGSGAPINNYQPSIVMNQLVQTGGTFPTRGTGAALDTIGMVHTFAGNINAFGMAPAQGQLQAISQNTALFSILGVTYGGDGKSNFALPDLTGRAVIGAGTTPGLTSYALGEQPGQAQNIMTLSQLPAHEHGIPGGVTGVTGLGGPMDNRQPALALNYQIAASGIFPSNGDGPFLGQIGVFAGNFEQGGWLQADGRLMSISQNTALFSVIGCAYGGDCKSTFALPNLTGRVAVGAGGGVTLGETFGSETTTLTDANLPSHTHSLPGGGFTDPEGGGLPFDNDQPSLGINYLIALGGVFPTNGGSGGAPDPDPFIGEVVGFAGDFAPAGWAFANGQLMAISQNTALFSLIGCTYGGDCKSTFALPDLRGRTILGMGDGFSLGQVLGEDSTVLTVDQLAAHDHTLPDIGGGVPEPGAWTLLIAGFGFIGAALRRRRPALA